MGADDGCGERPAGAQDGLRAQGPLQVIGLLSKPGLWEMPASVIQEEGPPKTTPCKEGIPLYHRSGDKPLDPTTLVKTVLGSHFGIFGAPPILEPILVVGLNQMFTGGTGF